MQKFAIKFVKGLYEAAHQQLRLFCLSHRWMPGDIISIFKITLGNSLFSIEFIFTYVGRGHVNKVYQQKYYIGHRQNTFSVHAVPFWNKLPTLIINASSVKSFKALLNAGGPCSQKNPYNPPPPLTNSFTTHDPTQKLTSTWLIPPTWSF